MIQLLIEALIVGIATSVIGYLFYWIIFSIARREINLDNTWLIIFILFLTGLSIHLISEFSGVNRWYCQNGYACM